MAPHEPELPGETPDSHAPQPAAHGDGQYTVVARRYRPQLFDELIGQEHVAKALSAAIKTDRVGHAYLFTGARGVGKTSAARILAKALDCVEGPTITPCNVCDVCQSVNNGSDVDVLEIDGASNRGIEEIRQLRSNVGIRPSRARYKIYIIDEVHMLTREAFNALLKTLEEPPEHVKFIFCTTEPTKIPVTVLSRCQKFDFAGISAPAIAARLAEIVRRERLVAEPEALMILARRAAGSMRDSQSLLEQLLAFGGEQITVADVHSLLGIADTQRLLKLAGHIAAAETAAALAELDAALHEGVDVGELLDQLLGVFRDAMASLAGCGGDAMLSVSSADEQQAIARLAGSLGLERVLAILQIIEETLARLRYSTHRRTLAEVAIVRICRLENLDELAALAAQLASAPPSGTTPAVRSGPTAGAAEVKKKFLQPAVSPAAEPPRPQPPSAAPPAQSSASPSETTPASPAPLMEASPALAASLHQESAESLWNEAIGRLNQMVSVKAKQYQRLAVTGPNRLEVAFAQAYNFCKDFCDEPQRKGLIEQALAEVVGATVRVTFVVSQDVAPPQPTAEQPKQASAVQRMRTAHENPLVRRARELFGARPVDFD